MVAGPLHCADSRAPALGKDAAARLDSDRGRGGSRGDRGIELRYRPSWPAGRSAAVVHQEPCIRARQRRAGWRVAANTASTTPVGHGQSGPRFAMAVRGTGALPVLVSCIDQAVGIDARLARRGARMDLSPSGRACSAARLLSTGVQHLAQVLQGMRSSA